MNARRDAAAAVGWPEKALWSVGLAVCFCVPYFAIQRAMLRPPVPLLTTRLDEAVRFSPAWVWMYQSGYLLLSIVPWLVTRRDDLRRYVRAFAFASAAGFLCFLLVPVTGPRPPDAPGVGMYGWLAAYDRPTNAFPSLHLALLTVTWLLADRIVPLQWPPRVRRAVRAVTGGWILLVAYAALATKQHYAVDLPAGTVLGLTAWRLAANSPVTVLRGAE